jgi:CBS domain-containing protein
LIEEALQMITANPAGAVPVLEGSKIVGVLDLPALLQYLLVLFGETTQKETVLNERAFGPLGTDVSDVMYMEGGGFGGYGGYGRGLGAGFHGFQLEREKSFTTAYADGVMDRGKRFFHKETVGEVMDKLKARPSMRRTELADAIAVTSPLQAAIEYWASGHANVCVFHPDSQLENVKFGFVSEMDSLLVLERLMDSHRLDLGKLKIKRFKLGKKKPHVLRKSTSVMHAFKAMQDEGFSALPIIESEYSDAGYVDDDKTMKVVGEFSMHSVHNLDAEAMDLILGSVNNFLHHVDPSKRYSSPLTCSRRDTLYEVMKQMIVSKKTHVWTLTKKQKLKGVVSLSDIWRVVLKEIK